MADLTGMRFGRLTALRYSHTAQSGYAYWRTLCDCGVELTVHGGNLRRGFSRSCGCLQREIHRERLTIHGQSPCRGGLKPTRTYNSWQSMNQRCTNPKVPNFKFYGGLGVRVVERWRSFENFLADMGERPAGKTLDRWPDPAGDYGQGNCRWATAKEQRINRR
jgi:hypothetical protein